MLRSVLIGLALTLMLSPAAARDQGERIEVLEQKMEAMADAYDEAIFSKQSGAKAVRFGGYGEIHYNRLDANGTSLIQLNFRRFVLFVGYDFTDDIRLVSELEVENTIVSPGNRGAVELEQAYLEFDLPWEMAIQGGLLLVPVGITNETHEPPTFYGVNRPIIETTIIPTTWWVGGLMLKQRFENGLSYNLMISEGFQTPDPSASLADPFDLKAGKQKTSFAAAHDLAVTARLRYRGITGFELASYFQYQPDIDQSAAQSYADSAMLLGGHAIYQRAGFKATLLYAHWFLAGRAAEDAGRNSQGGGHMELSYRPIQSWGVFVRHSGWSQADDVVKQQSDFGLNFWPHNKIVIKADMQYQNEEAGMVNGFNLGAGYQF